MQTYAQLIDQSFVWPQPEFHLEGDRLFFHQVDLMEVIQEYGTPLRFTYLPKITENVQRAKRLFQQAMQTHGLKSDYLYAYCTKSSHFRFVLEEVLKRDCHLETSSAYDMLIVEKLMDSGQLPDDRLLLCNGFKRPLYLKLICKLLNQGHKRVMPILDNMEELQAYEDSVQGSYPLGIRLATNEQPNFEFYTSRLGIRYEDVFRFYQDRLAAGNTKGKLELLHFFINTGIRDEAYFWAELNRFVETYCQLRKQCDTLRYLDIGGGLPIKMGLAFDFDYQAVVSQIVETIVTACNEHGVPHPHLVTEFGSFTVGESGGLIYSVLAEKQQNDVERWYMCDGSFINHLPDSWALNQKFILLAINNWQQPYQRVNLGGLTCDSLDYYNSEANGQEIYLPKPNGKQPQYVGFFHTGAYQDALGGYGGIQHCLVPAPRHVLLDKNGEGELLSERYADEQGADHMLRVLGYAD